MRQEPQTFTVEQAGRLLGVGRSLAYEAARTGQIPVIRVGKRLLVPKSALFRMLAAAESSPGVERTTPG